MNTKSIDFKFLIESDASPVILFNHKGHIVYLNDAGEILLGYINHKELFNIALKNAPKDYGSRTILMELRYHQLQFYAITVSYNSDEWIALRLYYRPHSIEESRVDSNRLRVTDINQLLDMAIGFFKLNSFSEIKLITDRELPPFKTDQNIASKLFRKTFEVFKSPLISISLTMVPGEYIIVNTKRYPVVRIIFKGEERINRQDNNLEILAESIGVATYFEEKEIIYDFPFIEEERGE